MGWGWGRGGIFMLVSLHRDPSIKKKEKYISSGLNNIDKIKQAKNEAIQHVPKRHCRELFQPV